MFYSRNIWEKDLVCIRKATTFAPTLREKHSSKSATPPELQTEIIFFEMFGGLEKSITFATRFAQHF